MCDYSLTNVKSRPAVVADRLTVVSFMTGTNGFTDGQTSRDEWGRETPVAVCLLPGTELAFDEPIVNMYNALDKPAVHRVARFRQINKDDPLRHHDALEFPDGEVVLLTCLGCNQHATVLQLPAAPKTVEEAKEQERVAWAG